MAFPFCQDADGFCLLLMEEPVIRKDGTAFVHTGRTVRCHDGCDVVRSEVDPRHMGRFLRACVLWRILHFQNQGQDIPPIVRAYLHFLKDCVLRKLRQLQTLADPRKL